MRIWSVTEALNYYSRKPTLPRSGSRGRVSIEGPQKFVFDLFTTGRRRSCRGARVAASSNELLRYLPCTVGQAWSLTVLPFLPPLSESGSALRQLTLWAYQPLEG